VPTTTKPRKKRNPPTPRTRARARHTVRCIGLDGVPKGEVPAEYTADGLKFRIDTAKFGGTMVYLIETAD